MRMDKYYTPDIEEFYVGFEYEIKDPLKRDWDKEFECKEDFLGHTIPCDSTKYKVIDFGWKFKIFGDYNEVIYKHDYEIPFDELQYIEKDGILEPTLLNYRVKYLNQEDIESLGWKFIEQLNLRGIRLRFRFSNFILDYISENNNLYIQTDDYIFGKFSGIIKNKSELKKLMKQLQING